MITNDNTDNTADERSNVANSQVNITRLSELEGQDIHDSPKDIEKMKNDIVVIDLPDVSDIPGQENIVVPNISEMHDTTISSDDEEGLGLFDDDEGDEDTEY